MAEKISKERMAIRCKHMYEAAQRWWENNGTPAVIGVEKNIDTSYGTVRVLEYGFENENAPLLFDLHGGGWILLHADSDEYMNAAICRDAGVRIVSIDYPKGPANPYPAALQSSFEIIKKYSGGSPVGVIGHSAGGNMAAALCLLANRLGGITIKYQILDYPVLDMKTDPFEKPEPDPDNMPASMSAVYSACYKGDADGSDPLISPLFASDNELAGVPPALIIVCGIDALRRESLGYEKKLRLAGVETELRDFPTMRHAFTIRDFPETDEAIGYMTDFIKRHI